MVSTFRKAAFVLLIAATACSTQNGDRAAAQAESDSAGTTMASTSSTTMESTTMVASTAPPSATAAVTPPAPGPRKVPVPINPNDPNPNAAVTDATNSSTAVPPDGARRISLVETRAALDSGRAVLIDVRTAEQWGAGHAAGAIHIPESEIVARMNEVPRDKMVITYCA